MWKRKKQRKCGKQSSARLIITTNGKSMRITFPLWTIPYLASPRLTSPRDEMETSGQVVEHWTFSGSFLKVRTLKVWSQDLHNTSSLMYTASFILLLLWLIIIKHGVGFVGADLQLLTFCSVVFFSALSKRIRVWVSSAILQALTYILPKYVLCVKYKGSTFYFQLCIEEESDCTHKCMWTKCVTRPRRHITTLSQQRCFSSKTEVIQQRSHSVEYNSSLKDTSNTLAEFWLNIHLCAKVCIPLLEDDENNKAFNWYPVYTV